MSSCDHRESDRLARLAVLADPPVVQPDHRVVPDRKNDGGEDVGMKAMPWIRDWMLKVLPSFQSLHALSAPQESSRSLFSSRPARVTEPVSKSDQQHDRVDGGARGEGPEAALAFLRELLPEDVQNYAPGQKVEKHH